MTAFAVPLMYNDKFMTVSLFTPISSLYSLVPTPYAIVQKVFDPNAFIVMNSVKDTKGGMIKKRPLH